MQHAIAALETAILTDRHYIDNCKADIKYYKDDQKKIDECKFDIERAKQSMKECRVAIKVLKSVKKKQLS